MKTVALFGSARPTPEQAIYGDTVNAARLLAAHGWTIATGGGPGLMEAANLGARETVSTCRLKLKQTLPCRLTLTTTISLPASSSLLMIATLLSLFLVAMVLCWR